MNLTIYRILEVALFALVNFVPYIVLALCPFTKSLRFRSSTTFLLIVLSSIAEIFLGLWAAADPEMASVISLISTLLYGLFYLSAVRVVLGKIMFVLLMLSNLANLIIVSSKCLEGIFFPSFARETYHFTHSLIMLSLQLCVIALFTVFYRARYIKALSDTTADYVWKYLWLIPALFYIMWYRITYFSNESSLKLALNPINTIYLMAINLGAFLIYSLILRLTREHAEDIRLRARYHALETRSLQYENLKERVSETRAARHDLRHHLTVIGGFLDREDYKGLRKYLDDYIDKAPVDIPIQYCENSAANIIIVYFAGLASKSDITFTAETLIPEDIPISSQDLSVLLGNLLENAVEACHLAKEEHPFIRLRGGLRTAGVFALTIDNSSGREPEKNRDGVFLSSKRPGAGIGIESVKSIAERYNGVTSFTQKDHVFYASVMLSLNDRTDSSFARPAVSGYTVSGTTQSRRG